MLNPKKTATIYLFKVADYTTIILGLYDKIGDFYYVQRGDGTVYKYESYRVTWRFKLCEYDFQDNNDGDVFIKFFRYHQILTNDDLLSIHKLIFDSEKESIPPTECGSVDALGGLAKGWHNEITKAVINELVQKYGNEDLEIYQIYLVQPGDIVSRKATQFTYFFKEKAQEKVDELNKEIHSNLTELEKSWADYYVIQPITIS